MSPKQNAVLWLGIILVFTRIFTTGHATDIYQVIAPKSKS